MRGSRRLSRADTNTRQEPRTSYPYAREDFLATAPSVVGSQNSKDSSGESTGGRDLAGIFLQVSLHEEFPEATASPFSQQQFVANFPVRYTFSAYMLKLSNPIKTAIFAVAFIVLTIKLISPTSIDTTLKETHVNMDIPLRVTISDITNVTGEETLAPVISLKVTIHNTSPDKPVLFLRWSTPLDPSAAAQGIFTFTSQRTGASAKCMSIKLNRKMPESGIYSSDDAIRIEAGGKVERSMDIKAPEVVLNTGEKYLVRAKGRWPHVLVGYYPELKMGDAGVLRGDFESNVVEFQVRS